MVEKIYYQDSTGAEVNATLGGFDGNDVVPITLPMKEVSGAYHPLLPGPVEGYETAFITFNYCPPVPVVCPKCYEIGEEEDENGYTWSRYLYYLDENDDEVVVDPTYTEPEGASVTSYYEPILLSPDKVSSDVLDECRDDYEGQFGIGDGGVRTSGDTRVTQIMFYACVDPLSIGATITVYWEKDGEADDIEHTYYYKDGAGDKIYCTDFEDDGITPSPLTVNNDFVWWEYAYNYSGAGPFPVSYVSFIAPTSSECNGMFYVSKTSPTSVGVRAGIAQINTEMFYNTGGEDIPITSSCYVIFEAIFDGSSISANITTSADFHYAPNRVKVILATVDAAGGVIISITQQHKGAIRADILGEC